MHGEVNKGPLQASETGKAPECEEGAASLRRLLLHVLQVVLRAGMALAVIAEIGAGRRIVGLVALRAVARRVAAAIGDHGY